MQQHCFVNRWATHWFRIDVQVPKEWVGSEVRLRWNSGSEALVWIDGCPKQVMGSFLWMRLSDTPCLPNFSLKNIL